MTAEENRARKGSHNALEQALDLLGPLEGRIMREVWTESVPCPFAVRDVQALMRELAYTTVMTTLNRLAEKGILVVERLPGQRAHVYRPTGSAEEFVSRTGREQVERVIERFGDAAMAAFAERLDRLSPERRQRLREMGQR